MAKPPWGVKLSNPIREGDRVVYDIHVSNRMTYMVAQVLAKQAWQTIKAAWGR